MTFLWPELLWLSLGVPVLIGLYVWTLQRKRKAALRYANLSLVREALSGRQRLRRHVPPLLFLLAAAILLLAVARPASVMTLPARYETIVLAMDVSGSMRATDVRP
ncbi:MAG TPA: BatA domain-containing protein, partial [Burkholderiales bacterium]|nr:BatA domain-containing protein [Burkholderiales bacterium]